MSNLVRISVCNIYKIISDIYEATQYDTLYIRIATKLRLIPKLTRIIFAPYL